MNHFKGSLLILLLACSFSFGKSSNEVSIHPNDLAATDARIHEAIEVAGILIDAGLLEQHLNDLVVKLTGTAPHTAPPYRIRVINSSELNAFSLSDGTIYISLSFFGMIDNDAQLAMLIAHEIAHVYLDHHREFRHELHRKAAALSNYGYITSYNLRVALSGFSISNENAADSFALDMMRTSGYNAWLGAKLFSTMYKWLRYKEKNYDPKTATHPELSKRFETITKSLQKMKVDSTLGTIGAASFANSINPHQEQIVNLLLQSNCVNELYTLALSKLDNQEVLPEWFYLRGILMERYHPRDSFKIAHYSLSTAYRQNPALSVALRDLGWLFLKNNQPDSARSYLSSYLAKTPLAADTSLILYYLESLND